MSDGNFNRSLLPRTDYQSGVRAGRARERQHALDAFTGTLTSAFPTATDEEKARALQMFRHALEDKE
jgi:hypothetical protein